MSPRFLTPKTLRLSVLAVALLVALAVLAACGKKGAPVPPGQEPPIGEPPVENRQLF